MNNDMHFSLVMIELEKMSTKINKLAGEVAEFRKIMNYPKDTISNFDTQNMIEEKSNGVVYLTLI